VHVGQSEVAAGVPVRESFVIETHSSKNRGVQVVHVHTVFHGP
jgi:hypothetical protein